MAKTLTVVEFGTTRVSAALVSDFDGTVLIEVEADVGGKSEGVGKRLR